MNDAGRNDFLFDFLTQLHFFRLSFFRIGITDSFIILPYFFSYVNTFSTGFLGLAILLSHIIKTLPPYVQYHNKNIP